MPDKTRIICFVCAGGIHRSARMRDNFSRFLRVTKLDGKFRAISIGSSETGAIRTLDESDIIVKVDNLDKESEIELMEATRHPENVITAADISSEAEKINEWGNKILGKIKLVDMSRQQKRMLHRLKPKKPPRRRIRRI